MKKRKDTRGYKSDLESEMTKFLDEKNTMNSVQYKPVDNQKLQIQRHEHVKDAKNVIRINWQNKVKI